MTTYSLKNPFHDFTKVQLLFFIILGVLVIIAILDVSWKIVGPKPSYKEGMDYIPLPKDEIGKAIVRSLNEGIDAIAGKIIKFGLELKGAVDDMAEGVEVGFNTFGWAADCGFSKTITYMPCFPFYIGHSMILSMYSMVVVGPVNFLKLLSNSNSALDYTGKIYSIDEAAEYLKKLYPSAMGAVCFKCTKKPSLDAGSFMKCTTLAKGLKDYGKCFLNIDLDGSTVIPQSRVNNAKTLTQVANGYNDATDITTRGWQRFGNAFTG
jgi:hypothetical protein